MRSVVVAFVLLIGVSANTSFACENWVAKVVSTNGLVEIKEGGQSKSAEIDSVVCPGQIISVAANSRAALYLSNNSFVRHPDSPCPLHWLLAQAGFWKRYTKS